MVAAHQLSQWRFRAFRRVRFNTVLTEHIVRAHVPARTPRPTGRQLSLGWRHRRPQTIDPMRCVRQRLMRSLIGRRERRMPTANDNMPTLIRERLRAEWRRLVLLPLSVRLQALRQRLDRAEGQRSRTRDERNKRHWDGKAQQ
jgi:hypothetical protein